MKQIFREWKAPEKWYVRVGKKKIKLGKPIDYGNKTMDFRHPETGKTITAYYGVEGEGYYIDISSL